MTASHVEFDRPVRGRAPTAAGARPELERRAMVLLGRVSPLTLAQLGRGLGISPQHARSVLFSLEGRGHVVREAVPPDLYTPWTLLVYRLRRHA